MPAFSAPVEVTEWEEVHAASELGAAQKDTARELAARLASFKPVTWVGVAAFLLGVVSLFWPPLKALIGSVTTSVALAAGGLSLVVLPGVIAGHELFLLGGVAAVVGAWFLAHRHGQLRGQLLGSESVAPPRTAQNPGVLPGDGIHPT